MRHCPLLVALLFAAGAVTGVPHRHSCRDRLQQPFAITSIWNMPIGSEAKFKPAGIFDGRFPPPRNFHNDQEFVLRVSESDPHVPWHSGYYQSCAVEGPVVGSMRLPADFVTDCGPNNNAAAVLQPDGRTFLQFQPVYRPVPGSPVMGQYCRFGTTNCTSRTDTDTCVGADCDAYGNGTTGAHGGSRLSAVGGMIRSGELLSSTPPIKHALKLELFGHYYYYWRRGVTTSDTCWRWPAQVCDGYAGSQHGNGYNGTNPELMPGSLLAVPAAVSSMLMAAIKTAPAKKILQALTTYGGYLVDDTASNNAAFCAEHSVNAEMLHHYGWDIRCSESSGAFLNGVSATSNASSFYHDLLQIFKSLHVVVNNNVNRVGGGGKPTAPLAPPICKTDDDHHYDFSVSAPTPASELPGTLVFDNPHYPTCCKTAHVGVCLYRIPVVLHIPGTPVVMAFAEARLGASYDPKDGCADGSGPGLAFRRSTDGGNSFLPVHFIANDTQPTHVAKKDHIVLGSVLFDHQTNTSFVFFTACYRRCTYTTAYVLRSTDSGTSWSSPSAGNLTDMLLEGKEGISMMQFGEGQGLVLPTGELLVCGWYKPKGLEATEYSCLNATGKGCGNVACLNSTTGGQNWSIKGRLPGPLSKPPGSLNEVAMGLMPNGSIFLSMRASELVDKRFQSRSDDLGRTFTVPTPGTLPAPRCNAGAINLDGTSRLVLAQVEPDHPRARWNLTFRASTDGGTSWPYRKLLWEHPAGYVTLTSTNNPETVGAMYENGEALYERRISYTNVPINIDQHEPSGAKVETVA